MNGVKEWTSMKEILMKSSINVQKWQKQGPKHYIGELHVLLIEFVKFYESNSQVDAWVVFKRAAGVEFFKVGDLASVWIECAEMEIR